MSKKYIQVNIYDRTLEDLEQQGIELKSVLKNMGCSKTWIVEGSLCEDEAEKEEEEEIIVVDDVETEVVEQELEESESSIVPPLSTTIANVKVPRCSTKIVSLQELPTSRFTLNMTENISKINSRYEEDEEIQFTVEKTLYDLIEKVVERENNLLETKPIPQIPLAILSMTVKNSYLPRSSTPIDGFARNFTLNIKEMISDIESDTVDDEIDPTLVEIAEPVPIKFRESPYSLRSSVSRSSSLQKPEKFPELRMPRKISSWERSRSFASQTEIGATEAPEVKGNHVQIKTENVPDRQEYMNYDYSYDDGGGDQFYSIEDQLPHHEEVVEEQRIYEDLQPLQQFENQYSYDLDHDYHAGDQNDHNSFQSTDETAQIDVDDSIRVYFPPSPTRAPTKSILSMGDSKSTSKKGVSFKVPKAKDKQMERERKERTYIITCSFEECNKTIHWKLRYGKRRLLDHAFSHCEEKFVQCRSCEFLCQTTCQMKYHYKKAHSDIKMSGFGIYSIPYDDAVVEKLWEDCFGAQKRIVGIVSRRRSKIAEQDETEVIEVEEEEREKLIEKETTIIHQ